MDEGSSLHFEDFHVHKSDEDFLGRGKFGFVYRCYGVNGEAMAAKLCSVNGSAADIKAAITKMEDEASLLQMLAASPHVVNLYGLTTKRNLLGIIMEYAPRGTLFNLIATKQVPWPLRLRLLCESAEGLTHLHSFRFDKRITHNDLKPDNILITEDFHAKICDFGGSNVAAHTSQITGYSSHQRGNEVHTVNYAAPEFLTGKSYNRTKAMDVFSYGMITYFVITRRQPFEQMESQTVIYQITNRNLPAFDKNEVYSEVDKKDSEIIALLESKMRECLSFESEQRPKISQVKDDLKVKLVDLSEVLENQVSQLKSELSMPSLSNNNGWIKLEMKCKEIFVPELDIPFDSPTTPKSSYPIAKDNIKATCSTDIRPGSTEKSGFIQSIPQINITDVETRFEIGDTIHIKTKKGIFATTVVETWHK